MYWHTLSTVLTDSLTHFIRVRKFVEETTMFRNNYVPLSVVFPIALLCKHGTLEPLFPKSVEVGCGCSAEAKAGSVAILSNAIPLFRNFWLLLNAWTQVISCASSNGGSRSPPSQGSSGTKNTYWETVSRTYSAFC